MSSHNRNPTGSNQYAHVRMSKFFFSLQLELHLNTSILADVDDEDLNEALKRYHREGKTSNNEIRELLKHELDYDLR